MPVFAWPWVLVWLAGCGSGVEPAPEPKVGWSPPYPPTAVRQVVGGEERTAIEIRFHHVGKLYQGFFADEERLFELGEGLAGCAPGEARLHITYDDARKKGRVVIDVASNALGCPAELGTDGALDLRPLVPLSRATTAYRNALAGGRDLRLYSFDVGLHVRDGRGGATLWVDGPGPTDGRGFGPCAVVDSFEACGEGEVGEAHTSIKLGDADTQQRLTSLLSRASAP